MKPIERKIDTLQDIATEIVGLLEAIQTMRGVAEVEIDGNGLTPETCASLAGLMAQLHENTAKLHNGGHLIHAKMFKFIPEGANEGQKPWPPFP